MKQKKRKLTAELIFVLTLLTLLFTSSGSGAWSSNRRVYKERTQLAWFTKNNFCKVAQRIYLKYFIWEFQCGGSLFGANYLSWSVITRNLDKVAFSYQSKSAEDKNIISLVIAIISRRLLSKHVFTKSALFSKIIILPSYNHPSWCLWPQCVPSCSCTHTTVRCDSLTDIQSFTSPHYNIQHL